MREFLRFLFRGKRPQCDCWVGNELKQEKVFKWENGSWYLFMNNIGWPIYVCPRCGKDL